jgi:hypothetical protein
MLSHRIVAVSAVLFAVTIGSAAAQEQTSVGKPLQLLQFARHAARHETKAPLHPHAQAVEEHAEVKRHIAQTAVARHHKLFAAVHPHRLAEAAPPKAVEPAPGAPKPSPWPAIDSATPGSIALRAPQAAPQNVQTEPVISDTSEAIVTDGKVAQAAPAPETNMPKLATDPHPAAAAPAPEKSAAAAPAVRAMIVRPAGADSDTKSPIGSAPWLLQVLAALGGALAAGAVAGFLILRGRSEPREQEFFAGTLAPGE